MPLNNNDNKVAVSYFKPKFTEKIEHIKAILITDLINQIGHQMYDQITVLFDEETGVYSVAAQWVDLIGRQEVQE